MLRKVATFHFGQAPRRAAQHLDMIVGAITSLFCFLIFCGGGVADGASVLAITQQTYTSGAVELATVDTETGKRTAAVPVHGVGSVLQNCALIVPNNGVNDTTGDQRSGRSLWAASMNETTTANYIVQVAADTGEVLHKLEVQGAGVGALAADDGRLLAVMVESGKPFVASVNVASGNVTALLHIPSKAAAFVQEGLASYCAPQRRWYVILTTENSNVLVDIDVKRMAVAHSVGIAGSISPASLAAACGGGSDTLYSVLQTSGDSKLVELDSATGSVKKTLVGGLLPYAAVPALLDGTTIVTVLLSDAQVPSVVTLPTDGTGKARAVNVDYAPLSFLTLA